MGTLADTVKRILEKHSMRTHWKLNMNMCVCGCKMYEQAPDEQIIIDNNSGAHQQQLVAMCWNQTLLWVFTFKLKFSVWRDKVSSAKMN